MNPLLWLELRLRISERRLWVIASFFLMAMGVVAAAVLIGAWSQRHLESLEPCETGRDMAGGAIFFQAGLLCLLAPLAAASRISMEREQRTMASLINSTVSRSTIAFGKIGGAWVFALWLGLLTFPFIMMASLWGGLPLGRILLALACNMICGLCLSTLAMGFSGFFGKSLTSYLVMGAFLFTWFAVLPLLGTILVVPLEMGGEPKTRTVLCEVINSLTIYHNPFYMLFRLLAPASFVPWQLAWGLLVWLMLGGWGTGMTIRGLKREVI